MRLLLDHCVPVDLAPHLRGHEVTSVRAMGWQNLDDGDLLTAMAGQFDVLVTADRSIPFQQLVAGRPVCVMILRAKSNRINQLARLVPALLQSLKSIEPGEVREIEAT